MKLFWKEVLACSLMGLVVPGIMLKLPEVLGKLEPVETISTVLEAPTEIPETTVPAETMSLLLADGPREVMEMEDYLVGVVLAEMPAYFESEALKAQSVAARTYTRKAQETGLRHDGSLCTDYACCQAYISEEEYLAKGGNEESVDKIRQAVAETAGLVLTYEGELIEATYFSCSGGSTEEAAAVWGADYPYLQAVASPGEENAEFFTDTVTFTPEQFNKALGTELKGDPATWIGASTATPGGGVDVIHIGGKSYEGRILRKLLGLRSTAFTMTGGEGGITVTTRGFGHRVGMSQYGADAMAASGHDFREILSHYYPGTTLEMTEESIA